MEHLFAVPYIALPLTVGLYVLGLQIHKWTKLSFLHPILLTTLLIIGVLLLTGANYEDYKRGAGAIDFLLGPSVVSLGYVLHQQAKNLKGRVLSILTSVTVGALVGVLSIKGIAYLMGGSDSLVATLQPKSVTTPIAMALAEQSGGIPSLTAVVVVISGIFGGIVGPPILRVLRIKSSVAKGLAMGASAHGLGTSVAIQMGAVEGALGGLAIGVMGVLTAVLIPVIDYLIALMGGS